MFKREFSDDFKLSVNNRYTELVKEAFKPIASDRLFFRYWKEVAPDKRLIMEQLADEFKITSKQVYPLIARNQIYSQMRKEVYDSRAVVFKNEFAKGISYEEIAERFGIGLDVIRRACMKQKRKEGYSFAKTLSTMNSFTLETLSSEEPSLPAHVPSQKGHSDYLKIRFSKQRRRL